MTKTVIKLNASSLPWTKCILQWHRHVIQGYKTPTMPANIVYGIAGHKYIDTMFKTGGDIKAAREAALKSFQIPKYIDPRTRYLAEETHFLPTIYNYYEDYIEKDSNFELLVLPNDEPATEVSFSIRYYEDEWVIVDLEGTMDKVGKFHGGCYAIGDYKFTSSWDGSGYLADYELSPQLMFYILAFKIAAEVAPTSVLGQIGNTNIGAFIDAIFIKAKPQDNEYGRSKVFQYKPETIQFMREEVDRIIQRLSAAVRDNTWDRPEGLVNGSCMQKFNKKCPFWFACRTQDKEVSKILLERDFVQRTYDPMHHQAE